MLCILNINGHHLNYYHLANRHYWTAIMSNICVLITYNHTNNSVMTFVIPVLWGRELKLKQVKKFAVSGKRGIFYLHHLSLKLCKTLSPNINANGHYSKELIHSPHLHSTLFFTYSVLYPYFLGNQSWPAYVSFLSKYLGNTQQVCALSVSWHNNSIRSILSWPPHFVDKKTEAHGNRKLTQDHLFSEWLS